MNTEDGVPVKGGLCNIPKITHGKINKKSYKSVMKTNSK